MMKLYPGNQVDLVQSNYLLPSLPIISINNVLEKFESIPQYGDYIRAHPDDTFGATKAYKKFSFNKILEKYRKTHFQGIARTKAGNYIILSGGDNKENAAQLFIIQLKSYLENRTIPNITNIKSGALGSNVVNSFSPPKIDKVVNIIKINTDPRYWHGGGISVFGDILAVPIEGEQNGEKIDDSKIKFFDISNPVQPLDLSDKVMIHDEYNKAGAVSLIRLPSQRYLCAVWVDSNKHDGKKGKLTFYLSKNTNLLDGFQDDTGKYIKEAYPFAALNKNKALPRFQSIHLLLDDSNKLFIICTDNRALLSPITRRKNRAFIYEVRFSGQSIHKSNFKLTTISLHHPLQEKWKEGRIFPIGEQQYNFDAGTGIYVSPDRNLSLYSVHHWRKQSFINLAEFYPNGDSQITHIDESIIELYSKKDYDGKTLKIYGKRNSRIDNYDNIQVEDLSFDNSIMSIRVKLPVDESYAFYENIYSERGDESQNRLIIKGSGKWIEIPNLNDLNISRDAPRGIHLKIWNKKLGRKIKSSGWL